MFFNPGSLPDSITIKQLLANTYVSTPRNRQIAKMVKEMGMIERYGTGIKRVRRMFTDYGLPEPHFEIIPGGFAVTVFANTDKDPNSSINIASQPVSDSANNVTDNVTDNRSKLLIKLIKEDNGISTTTLAHKLGVTRMTVARDIEILKTKGIINRIGPDKGGHWEILPHP